MKNIKIYLVCTVFCVIAFTQCNKEESISEIIAQVEVSYDNLDKVVTIWKEGDEKVETSWEEGCGKEPYEDYINWEERTPKMNRLSTELWSWYEVAVIKLGEGCGNFPELTFFMDCENSGNITHIKNWDYLNNKIHEKYPNEISWLANGIKRDTKGDLTMKFCLLPNALDFPVGMIDNAPWAIIALSGYMSQWGAHSRVVRHIDNEDSNNQNSAHVMYQGTKTDLSKSFSSGFSFNGLNQRSSSGKGDSNFQFAVMDYWTSGFKTFPYKGFDYAVFSKKPIKGGYVAEVLSDDEDTNNTNYWKWDANTVEYPKFKDFGFIQGERNTHFYVTRAY